MSGYGILKNLVTQSILTPMQIQDPPNDTPEPFHNLKSLVITARSKKKQQQKKHKSNQISFFDGLQADS